MYYRLHLIFLNIISATCIDALCDSIYYSLFHNDVKLESHYIICEGDQFYYTYIINSTSSLWKILDIA